jgi:hypothetical protein
MNTVKSIQQAVMDWTLALMMMAFAPTSAWAWWQPTPGTSWQIQLTGKLDTSFDVAMYDVDLVETPQAVIDDLHSRGIKVVCYFSAGSYENWRPDAADFPAEVLGAAMAGWPGERWLDIRRIDLLAPIMEARLDLAQQKQCDGVDPDNVEGYNNKSGFPLTADDQLQFNQWIANAAHARNLAVGLKNDIAQAEALVGYFDFQVNEQCFAYKECDYLTPFIDADKPVFSIEYKGRAKKFCEEANARNFDTLKKRRNLKVRRYACR